MSKYSTKNYQSLFGIILILVGLSFIIPDAIIFNIVWQVLIVIWGILNLRDKNYIYGIILLVFGIVLLFSQLFNSHILIAITGAFLIAVGGRLLWDNLKDN